MKHTHLFLKWDLGEFRQKGSIATRWGTKAELLQACRIAKQYGIDILIDAILNVLIIFATYSCHFSFEIFEAQDGRGQSRSISCGSCPPGQSLKGNGPRQRHRSKQPPRSHAETLIYFSQAWTAFDFPGRNGKVYILFLKYPYFATYLYPTV